MLADNKIFEGGQIDIFIGAEIFWNLLGSVKRNLTRNGPILFETKLGWVLGGKFQGNNFNNKIISNVCFHFWEIENVENNKEFNLKEKIGEDIFKSTYTRDANRRFV